ncbi:hypothetical protein [Thalassobellus suaedae]|uniref:Uncharacterized protein n=1 Tax=Thalassobellus suaedae TaxID=3074124 RepID=A0ABY9XWB3_9FLAO|nr:hypothetical protein RHP51_04920 [Flavobacteriaceae bacterium HL-DH14]
MEQAKPGQDPVEPIIEKPVETAKATELNDDAVTAYLKNKYKDQEFNTVEDLFKKPEPQTKEVEKIVNPYADVMDEETKAYLDFRKETGRSRKEFEFLAEDITSKSPLELSREKIRQETGLKLDNAQADEYLEKKLGLDLSDSELSSTDNIELTAFSKPYKDSLLEQQEKYRKPLDEVLKANQNKVQEKFVELENGVRMTETQYKDFETNRLKYQEDIKKAVDSVASFNFKIPIDNNGEKSELEISYELSKEDKHSMLSDALDVDATIAREFQTEEGFNHSELAQTLHRGLPKNFNKIMSAMAKQVRAATIEEMTANHNNENFDVKPMQKVKTGKEGYGELPSGETRPKTFGIKASGF